MAEREVGECSCGITRAATVLGKGRATTVTHWGMAEEVGKKERKLQQINKVS